MNNSFKFLVGILAINFLLLTIIVIDDIFFSEKPEIEDKCLKKSNNTLFYSFYNISDGSVTQKDSNLPIWDKIC